MRSIVTWWKQRTKMEKVLTLFCVIVSIIVIFLVIALAVVLYKHLHNAEPLLARTIQTGVCSTPGCLQAASKVLANMDKSVDPCDDFYMFACGNFMKNTNIPDDKTSVTMFSVLSDTLQEQLRTMVEEPIKKREPQPFQLIKKLYKACMNTGSIAVDGLNTMKKILKKLGGWPVLDGKNWRENEFDWKEAVYKFRKVGYSVDYFFDFTVGVDLKNSSRHMISVDQPALSLERQFFMKGLADKIVSAYFDYMVDTAIIFGADSQTAKEELRKSMEFQMQLANISLPPEKRRNVASLINPMTIKEMEEKYSSIPWLKYFNTLLAPDSIVQADEIVNVNVPSYFEDFQRLMDATPKRVQANYLIWRPVSWSVEYLTEELRNRQLKYFTSVTGKTERGSRWKECIEISTGVHLQPIAAGALYVRKYFREDARQNAKQMVANIRSEFRKIVKQVDWMDETTRQSALEKADSMSTHIAYPDELMDDKKLEDLYYNLEVDPNHYLESVINLTLFTTQFSYALLRQPVNKSHWITHGSPAVVNAFYSPGENSIQFPAGILQGSFFNNDRPNYMNYGGIGFVIGHEITHGFDDQGRQFDKNGNLVDWWKPETRDAFVKKAQCIIEQYGNYKVPEININVNGINTQGENIADNGGIKEAYLAYNKWAKDNNKEKKLPGLDYTPQQMFWISAGQMYCSKLRPENLKMTVLTGQHSPGYFRVIGSLSNSDEFAKDFKCPVGSKMNPKHKCKVW